MTSNNFILLLCNSHDDLKIFGDYVVIKRDNKTLEHYRALPHFIGAYESKELAIQAAKDRIDILVDRLVRMSERITCL